MKKILVPIKRVPDWQIKVKVAADGRSIDQGNLKWIINTFDEIAVEEAVRIKEKHPEFSEISVVCIGPAAASEQLRSSLALGADKAIHVVSEKEVDSEQASKVLSQIVSEHQFDLVIMGKQAIDSDSSQTGQRMAGILNWPQATFASKVEFEGDYSSVKVVREVDGGLETLKLKMPAIITTDLRLNEPRLRSLPAIVAAKKKPLEEVPISKYFQDLESRTKIIAMTIPPKRSQGKKLGSVSELVAALRDEAKVI